MTTHAPDNTNKLEAAVIASITNFFVSTVGATLCDADERPSEGVVHVHFSNRALSSPLSFALPETDIENVVKAQQTLLMTEPLPPSMRLEFHQPGGSEARGHLGFLQARLPSRSADEKSSLFMPVSAPWRGSVRYHR